MGSKCKSCKYSKSENKNYSYECGSIRYLRVENEKLRRLNDILFKKLRDATGKA